MSRFFSSLRFRLILLVLIAILPAGGVVYHSGLEQRQLVASLAKEEAMRLARLISNNHRQLIEGSSHLLFILAQLSPVRKCEPASCASLFADLLKQYPWFLNIGAAYPNGNIFASAVPMPKPINIADRSYFQLALETRQFAIGDYQIGRIVGKPVINFGYPVLNDAGKVKAIVYVAMDLTWLNNLSASANLPPGSSITVVNHNSTILARHPEPEKWVGKNVKELPLFKTILSQKEGMIEAMGLEGVQRLYAFTPFGGTGQAGNMYISMGIPTHVVFAQVDKILNQNLIALAFIGLLALLAVWVGGDLLILRRLNPLVNTAKRLAAGDLSARTKIGYGEGELNQLASTFDEMAKSLELREAERKLAEEARRKSEEEAKRLAQEKALIAEIGRIIGSKLNIDEVFDRFSKEVAKLLPCDRIVINLYNPEKDATFLRYVAGIDVPERRIGKYVSLAGAATAECVRTKSTLLIQPENEKGIEGVLGRFPKLLPNFKAGIRSIVMIPLITEDQVIGIMNLRSTKTKAYTDQDVRLAEMIAFQIAGAVANAQLFSKHEGAEKALRESEERYRNVLDNMEEGYYEVDCGGNFIFFSESLCKILGYSRKELMGMNNRKYMDKETAKRVYQTFNRVYRSGEPNRGVNWEVIRKDGAKRILETSVSLIKAARGESVGFRGIIRDVTERKQAEEEKRSLEDQLRQSQKMEAIGQLAGGIAHDFNNLLNIMGGYSQLALMELKEGDRFSKTFKAIEDATTKAANLVRQILAFSRRQVMEMVVLDLNNLLGGLEKMLRRMIGEDIELLTVLADDLGRIKADPGQIEQVVFNLAINARDAMSQGGKLTIETANVELDEAYAHRHVAVIPGRYVMLAVSDTGVGMTPEVRERVFEPFFTTKEKGKGTGLGLSTVYGIVKQSGGNIWVYSEPGQGTTFKIYLPRVDEAPEEIKRKEERDELPLGWETILVVEDEEEVRKLAVLVLQKQGYRVLEAAQGGDALLICEQHKDLIHLMLTDVVMPRMSGRELAERLASLHPEMKVLFMSGYTDIAILQHGVLEEGVNFIQKPFTLDGLARKVREVLDKDPKPAQAATFPAINLEDGDMGPEKAKV